MSNFFKVSSATANTSKRSNKGSSDAPTQPKSLPQAGGHLARVVKVLFLGEHNDTFDPSKKPMQRMEVTFELVNSKFDRVINRETGETQQEPHWLSKVISVSASDKSNAIKWANHFGMDVTKVNEYSFQAQGKEITVREYDTDWSTAIGKPCQVFVQIDEYKDKRTGEDRQTAKIKDVMPAMQGIEVPPLFDEDRTKLFTPLDDSALSIATYNEMPDWFKEKHIHSANDWNSSPLKRALDDLNGEPVKEVKKSEPKPKVEDNLDDDVPFDMDDPFND